MSNINFSNHLPLLDIEIDFCEVSHTPNKFSSPLKKRKESVVDYHSRIKCNISENTPVKRFKAIEIKESNGKETRTLFKFTPLHFSDEYLIDLSPILKEQSDLITKYMSVKNYSLEQQKYLRSLIIEICFNPNLSENEKYAELGVFYFYIVSEIELPPNREYLQSRIREIEIEALRLKQVHKENCPSHLRTSLSSGRNAYLMRAFVRMIFTFDGEFNKAGCEALKIMMNSRLCIFITEECRTQVLKVIIRLTEQESFRDLFMKNLKVHPDLEKLIMFDLKLPKEEKICNVYVRWALLIFLFSPIGQMDEPNCYAVATLSNLLNSHNHVPLVELIDALESGILEIGNVKIPILPLIQGRQSHESDFWQPLSSNNFSGMTAFSMLSERLQTQKIIYSNPSINMPLNNMMTQSFGPNADYAKQIFSSLKQNFLQQMALSIIQFRALNSFRGTTECLPTDSQKNILFYYFNKYIPQYFVYSNNNEANQNFTLEFQKILSAHFFLIDYRNWKGTVEDSRVMFEFHEKGLLFNGNLSDYESFDKESRLFYLNSGNLAPVDSISFLGVCFGEIAQKLQKSENFTKCDITGILNFFDSNKFKETVSLILQGINLRKSPLSASIYNKSDSFFMAQNGCGIDYIDRWEPLSSTLNPQISITSKTVLDLFIKICSHTQAHLELNPIFADQIDLLALADSRAHVFNFQPLKFSEYWIAPSENLKRNTIDRIKNNPHLTKMQKTYSLAYIIGFENINSSFQSIIDKKYRVARFSKEAKKLLSINFHNILDQSILQVLHEVPLENLGANLIKILSQMSEIDNPTHSSNIIMKSGRISNVSHFMSPYRLAKAVHKALLSSTPSIYITRNILDKKIREFFSIPEVIELGNLNWLPYFREKYKYVHLYLKYDFEKKDFIFQTITKGTESPLEEEFAKSLLERVSIRFPKIT